MEAVTKQQLKRRNKYFKRRSFSNFSTKEKIVMGIIFVIFTIYAFTLLYPFFYLVVNSFKAPSEFIGSAGKGANYFWITLQPTIQNFVDAINGLTVGSAETNIGMMYFNSITLSIGQTIVSMAMTCCAAYVLAKYDFKGNKFIYTLVLVCSFIPTIASFPATYQLMFKSGMAGSYLGMIALTSAAFGGTFLYIHSYFKAVPWSFAESAMMDGASDFRVFWQIMLPLARNGILTFTLIKFLGFWNDYWLPSLFYSDNPTIAVGIAGINNNSNTFPVICAAMVLAVLPVLIFYAIFQKKLLQNTIAGGIKG